MSERKLGLQRGRERGLETRRSCGGTLLQELAAELCVVRLSFWAPGGDCVSPGGARRTLRESKRQTRLEYGGNRWARWPPARGSGRVLSSECRRCPWGAGGPGLAHPAPPCSPVSDSRDCIQSGQDLLQAKLFLGQGLAHHGGGGRASSPPTPSFLPGALGEPPLSLWLPSAPWGHCTWPCGVMGGCSVSGRRLLPGKRCCSWRGSGERLSQGRRSGWAWRREAALQTEESGPSPVLWALSDASSRRHPNFPTCLLHLGRACTAPLPGGPLGLCPQLCSLLVLTPSSSPLPRAAAQNTGEAPRSQEPCMPPCRRGAFPRDPGPVRGGRGMRTANVCCGGSPSAPRDRELLGAED